MRSVDISKFVVEINTDESLDPSVVGSKAAAVAELFRHKIKVPSCFTIKTSVFDDFIRPVTGEITTILKKVETDSVSSAFEAAESISEILASQELPVGLTESVKSRLISTKNTLAVRSSATTEDLKDASFAGIYDSFLDATTLESVLRRIRDVWDSYYAGRAISYRQQKGIAHQSGSMAVLVMDLIDAEAAGVMFTRDPRDGSNRVLINVALGLGEGFAVEITNPSAIAEPDHQPPIGHREAARRVVELDLAHQFPAWLEDGHSRIAGDINQAVGHGHVTRLAKSGRTPAIGFRFGGIGVGAGLHCHADRGDGLGPTAEKLAPRRIRLTVAGRATAVGRGF